jgi:selenide,water dikinase
VLVGAETSDDAAVIQLTEELALVLTVDYFTPIVDDPYAFGQIAAANSLSDVYAMGGEPLALLSIVGFPKDKLPFSILSEILRGGADKAREAGVSVVGGHTIDDAEPKCGYAAVGTIHPKRILKNVGARPGDCLLLTKPLGTGIISTAIKREKASPEAIQAAVTTMATLNRDASLAVREVGGVHAMTDVTGFGLLGHLREMTAGSKVGVRLRAGAVPLLPQVRELALQGLIPGGTQRNYQAVQAWVRWDSSLAEVDRLILSDAQTSGGLLIAVSSDRASQLIEALLARGVQTSSIGEVIEEDPLGGIEVSNLG